MSVSKGWQAPFGNQFDTAQIRLGRAKATLSDFVVTDQAE
jgi:hypothetical protein